VLALELFVYISRTKFKRVQYAGVCSGCRTVFAPMSLGLGIRDIAAHSEKTHPTGKPGELFKFRYES